MIIKFEEEIQRWNSMVRLTRTINAFFSSSTEVSLYHMSFLNPLNVISLRLLSRLFGVSHAFWNEVIVPLYASSFLTIRMNGVPAVILPVLDDLIPLVGCPVMHSWSGCSREVFDRIAMSSTEAIHESESNGSQLEHSSESNKGPCLVRHYSHEVLSVMKDKLTSTWTISTTRGTYQGFDAVVYASSSKHVLSSFKNMPALARRIMECVRYTDDHDKSFVQGIIHSDVSVLPSEQREELLSGYANFIQGYEAPSAFTSSGACEDKGSYLYENTFILSSWIPAVQGKSTVHSGTSHGMPRLVTYGARNPDAIINPIGTVDNISNHPELSMLGLMCVMLVRFIQGGIGCDVCSKWMSDESGDDGEVYYCGSFATPGNGHDLSFCSGWYNVM
jgi:hypothetical protein